MTTPGQTGHRHFQQGRTVLAVAVMMFTASACSSAKSIRSSAAPTNSRTTPTSPSQPIPIALTAEYPDDFSFVCKGEVVSNADPYAGSNPHPMVLFVPGQVAVGDTGNGYKSSDVIFDDPSWNPPSLSTTQLVGCFDRQSATLAMTCQYDSGPVNFYNATYKLTIREAHTARILGTATVPGESDSHNCPIELTTVGSDPSQYAGPDQTAAQGAVRTYVQRQTA